MKHVLTGLGAFWMLWFCGAAAQDLLLDTLPSGFDAELYEGIASPLSGNFSASANMQGAWSQDMGSLSGNTDGFDGFNTVTGAPGRGENFSGEYGDGTSPGGGTGGGPGGGTGGGTGGGPGGGGGY